MTHLPLGVRIASTPRIKQAIYEAASVGAKGVILEAIDDLAPQRLSETGRRELLHLLRTTELRLIGLTLPTRRPFETADQLDDRLSRIEQACQLGYRLGTNLILLRAGTIPEEHRAQARAIHRTAIAELGLRADRQGVRIALETAGDRGVDLADLLEQIDCPALGVSVDPGALILSRVDPIQAVGELHRFVRHAYLNDGLTHHDRPSQLPSHPRGSFHPPGSLDWHEYLAVLEEIGYRDALTLWPQPDRPIVDQVGAALERLNKGR